MTHPSPLLYAPLAIDPSVQFGRCCTIWQFTTILPDTVIGNDVVIGSGCWIGRGCVIGNGVHINHGCFLPHGTVLEDGVFLGPGVIMTDDKHPRAGNKRYRAQPSIVRKRASIGAGAVILPGVEIGADCMVGAGTVGTRNIAPNVTAIGLPARPMPMKEP